MKPPSLLWTPLPDPHGTRYMAITATSRLLLVPVSRETWNLLKDGDKPLKLTGNLKAVKLQAETIQ
jgi:hypothetical protein